MWLKIVVVDCQNNGIQISNYRRLIYNHQNKYYGVQKDKLSYDQFLLFCSMVWCWDWKNSYIYARATKDIIPIQQQINGASM